MLEENLFRTRSFHSPTNQSQHTAVVTGVVESLVMVVVATRFREVVTANYVPQPLMIAAFILCVVSKHPKFTCLTSPCNLEKKLAASEASIHHSTRSLVNKAFFVSPAALDAYLACL